MDRPRFLTLREGIAVAVLAAVLLAWLLWPKPVGAAVEVTRGGEVVGVFSLTKSARVRLEGELPLTVVVEDGRAWVEEASCPDRLCQRHRPISDAGESIVCLPAQVIVRVKGGSGDGPDAVSG